MTLAEKLDIAKRILGIGDDSEDELLTTYLTVAGKEIVSWRYSYAPEQEDEREVPGEYDMTQVFAVIAGYSQGGAENQTSHSENGMWLQGMYIYDAMARIAPILHAFAKKGTKAQPYVEEAYPISKRTVEDAQIKKEKARSQKGVRYMEALMARNNKRFEERK